MSERKEIGFQNLKDAVSRLENAVEGIKQSLNILVTPSSQERSIQEVIEGLYKSIESLKAKVAEQQLRLLQPPPPATNPLPQTSPTTAVSEKKETTTEQKKSEEKAEKTLSSFELYNMFVIILTFVFSIILDIFVYRYESLLDQYNINSQQIVLYILLSKYALLLVIVLLYILNYGFYESKKALVVLMFLAILAISGLIVFFIVRLFQMIQIETLKQKAFDAYVNSYFVVFGTVIIVVLNLIGTIGSFVLKIRASPKSCPLRKSDGKKKVEIEMKELKH